MKLISMTDYVLGIELLNQTAIKRLDMVFRYTKFLKTPLELGMFVPTDEDGNVLEEPNPNNRKYSPENNGMFRFVEEAYNYDVKRYNKAKERVIFENCSMYNKCFIRYGRWGLLYVGSIKEETMEFLCDVDLTLTQNAIKTYKI